MSEGFNKFLKANFGQFDKNIENTFRNGLKKSSGTVEGLVRMGDSLFNTAAQCVENENDKKALRWCQSFIAAFHKNGFEATPKVRETLFFPSQRSLDRLVHWIGTAQEELLVCVFTITNNILRDAVYNAWRRGCEVRVISDDECAKQQGSDVEALQQLGCDVVVDDDPGAHMHNKYVIIDGKILITGSFNWTVSAVKSNNENLVVLDDQALVEMYESDFDALWQKFRTGHVSKKQAAGKKFQYEDKMYRANLRG